MSQSHQATLSSQRPATLHGSIEFEMSSKLCGRTYRIFVFRPDTAPPPSGYPVVVASDGNMTFPIIAAVNATLMLTGQAALVVGVGYATADPMALVSLRTRDLTPPTPLPAIPHRPGLPPPRIEDYGGSEEFYRFLTEELLPVIADTYPTDAGNRTLYGHSWGGLFTLGVLLRHPEAFRTFVASSPSIWWNKRSILDDVPGFIRRVRARDVAPRALITVGGAEQKVPDPLPPVLVDGVTKRMPAAPAILRRPIAKLVAWKMVRDYRMVSNARELAARLRRVKGAPAYMVRYHVFAAEDHLTHLTALPASIGRALDFALRR